MPWPTWALLLFKKKKKKNLYHYFCQLLSAGQHTMSQNSDYLKLASWTWQWIHHTQKASTVTWPQSNRGALWCIGMKDLHLGCAADKSAAPCYVLQRINSVLKVKVQPSASKMYLSLAESATFNFSSLLHVNHDSFFMELKRWLSP